MSQDFKKVSRWRNNSLRTCPDMRKIFHARLYGRLIEMQSNVWRKKLHRTKQGYNFFGAVLTIYIMWDSQSNLYKKDNFRIWKDDFDHFNIISTSVVRLVKRNKLSFSSIEIKKPLSVLVHSVFWVRFKFRSQL